MGKFIRKLDSAETVNEHTRIAMLLIVLTACRKAEVINAKWSEFDLKNASWEIPAGRMKVNRTPWVPLSKQALLLVKQLGVLVPSSCEHLFPNRDDPSRPMADRSLNALMERLGFGREATPHGMRATFSTYFNAAGANTDVIEHCLAHAPANRVHAAYNRHAHQTERRALLKSWAQYIDEQRVLVAVPPAESKPPVQKRRQRKP